MPESWKVRVKKRLSMRMIDPDRIEMDGSGDVVLNLDGSVWAMPDGAKHVTIPNSQKTEAATWRAANDILPTLILDPRPGVVELSQGGSI